MERRFRAPVFVNFDWADVADPSGVEAYHIQVSPNPNFTDNIIAQLNGWYEMWVTASEDATDFPSTFAGTFYWRVRTLDSTHNLSAWSQVRSFIVGEPAPPSTPTLVSPANNINLPPNTQITFIWNAAANAATYDIQIDDSSNFSNPLTVSLIGNHADAVYAFILKHEALLVARARTQLTRRDKRMVGCAVDYYQERSASASPAAGQRQPFSAIR